MEITFPFLAKLVGATVLAGTITLGAATSWNGRGTVDNAISTIQEQAGNLSLYESNEKKLAEKIEKLKEKRDLLNTQIGNLTAASIADAEEIASLKGQIADLDAQIIDLNEQITTLKKLSDENGDTLAQRISDLEAQLTEANTDIDRLKDELAANTSTDGPLTETEMATLLEEGTEETEVIEETEGTEETPA